MGRDIPDAEAGAARRLVSAVEGRPLSLRQAAALVRLDGRSFGGLADGLTRVAAPGPDVLDAFAVAGVHPQARQALAVLTLTGG
ncbi:hypothetical protein, partial [Streptomyces flavofungini]|uniref:hypothetical protein n=1 Tax=Streptomyces flavofungini TaxID=68200 RepID=UPI0034DF5003